VFDGQGQAVLKVGEPDVDEHSQLALAVIRDGETKFVDLHRNVGGQIEFGLMSPFITQTGQAIGTLYVEINADDYLYPLLQSWPIPHFTTESFLVRRDGSNIDYISPMHIEAIPAMTKRVPLDTPRLPAAAGLQGFQGIYENGIDYRGKPVLSYVSSVKAMPWVMEIKMDEEEADAPIHRLGWYLGTALAAILFFTYWIVWLIWRNQTLRHRLAESAALYARNLIETSPDPLVTISPDGKITDVNAATEMATGWPRDALIGTEFADYFTEPMAARAGYQQVFKTGSVRDYELKVRHRDGHLIPVLYNASVYRDETGELAGVFAAARDITDRKRAEELIRESEIRFRTMANAAPVFIWVAGTDMSIIWVNQMWLDFTGRTIDQEAGNGWTENIYPEDYAQCLDTFTRHFDRRENFRMEYRMRRHDGEYRWIIDQGVPTFDGQGNFSGFIGSCIDITQIKDYQDKIKEIAFYDDLTGLPNRRLVDDRLNQALAQAERSEQLLAVCYLDLDGFKPINDTYGHAAGDRLLIEIARRLQASVRANDTVGRMGGDEFVLLLTGLENVEEYQVVLERVIEAINQPVAVDATPDATVTSSIGVALFPQDATSPDTLLRYADQSMYIAKQNGRNRYQFFDRRLERRMEAQRETLERIRQGLEHGEFCLYFQPQVDFGSKAVVGVEALIRWQHPTDGLLEPAEFLPAVEHDDIALEIGDWVIREALRQMQIWRGDGVDLQVSINTFARQLRKPDFLASLRQILSEYPDIPPSRLKIEITETAALPELPIVQQIITDCQQLGISFSIDDFGTGYCSMIYLRHLSATEIKIDRSFVLDMLTNHEDQAIVEGIIALGCAFHRSVIAEGVETSGQMHRLLELGCKAMQGYGIARPMPPEQIVAWVRDFQPAQLLS
jgi:diguanylate cyclase (GGDEF)-like protein/PAS domain S-box-containing protein